MEPTMTTSGPRTTREPDEHDGVFGSFIALTIGMLESTVRTTGGICRSVCSESQKMVGATIDWSEETQKALFRTARQLNESSFGLAGEAIARTERAALVVLGQTQRTGDRASELAAQTSQAVMGSRGLEEAPRAARA